jgi:DNA-binding CsgD family transcriptional regulator
MILGIAERTVIFHVENAKKNLGVYSRSHAVVQEIMLGLMDY